MFDQKAIKFKTYDGLGDLSDVAIVYDVGNKFTHDYLYTLKGKSGTWRVVSSIERSKIPAILQNLRGWKKKSDLGDISKPNVEYFAGEIVKNGEILSDIYIEGDANHLCHLE